MLEKQELVYFCFHDHETPPSKTLLSSLQRLHELLQQRITQQIYQFCEDSFRQLKISQILVPFIPQKNLFKKLVFYKDEIILSNGGDHIIRIWDPKEGIVIGELQPDKKNKVVFIVLTHNTRHVIASCMDGTIYFWNFKSHKIEKKLKLKRPATTICLSHTDRIMVTSFPNKIISIFNDFNLLKNLELDEAVRAMCFSKDDGQLLICSSKGFYIIDTKNFEINRKLHFTISFGPCLILTRDDRFAFTISRKSIHIWNIQTDEVETLNVDEYVSHISISPDEKYIVATFLNQSMNFLDWKNKKLIYSKELGEKATYVHWYRDLIFEATDKEIIIRKLPVIYK